ncbi:glycine cleavage system transcriptional repressor [Microbacterium gilvum]|uniref:Glycine cleavage system regulatory protein n=1 Tax=Microbacterium gilvum TaxID=1336204 RepID=A0ABP9A536_9MICO
MTTLVLTVIGDDRAGLVAAIADVVDAHGGNWETSRLAELDGTFAGVVQVSVPSERVAALREGLDALDGLLTVVVRTGSDGTESDGTGSDGAGRSVTLRVLGDDRPGIVREVSSALRAHGLSIESMATETRDAAMAGGRLFEATAAVRVADDAELDAAIGELERIAADIQVDLLPAE